MFRQYHFRLKSLFRLQCHFSLFQFASSGNLLCCQMCTFCTYFVQVHSSSCGNRCTHLTAHLSERLNPLSVIILVATVIRKKRRLQYKLLHHRSSYCRLLIVIDELDPFHQQLHQTFTLRKSIAQLKQEIQLCYGGCYDIK